MNLPNQIQFNPCLHIVYRFRLVQKKFVLKGFFSLLILLCLLPARCRAGVTVPFKVEEFHVLNDSVEFLLEANPPADLNGILSGQPSFKLYADYSPEIQMQFHPMVWSRIEIENTSSQALHYNFYCPNLADSTVVYHLAKGKLINQWRTGLRVALANKPLKRTGSAVILTLPPGKSVVYVRQHFEEEGHIIYTSFGLYRTGEANLDFALRSVYQGGYAGIMLIIGILTLLFFFMFRDRVFIYFSLFVWIFAVYYLQMGGLLGVYWWIDTPVVSTYGNHIIVSFLIFSLFLLITRYIRLKEHYARWYWVMLGYTFISISMSHVVYAITNDRFISISASNISLMLWVVAMISIIVAVARKGFRPAITMLISISVLGVSSVVFMLMLMKVLPRNFLTANSMQFATIIFSGIIFYGLFDYVRLMRNARAKAEKEARLVAQENERIVREQNVVLEKKVRERTLELEKEKDKSEHLLLNILPKEVADELKAEGKATPRNYDEVTVLFLDFVHFTSLAEQLTPVELVGEIDKLFGKFDNAIKHFSIEKIKTIGDAYLCASGLPQPSAMHAQEMVQAALQMLEILNEEKEERQLLGLPAFDARVGIHTGPVVAGVVGIKKFAYDIWGDTVNIAARMESSSEPGRINISATTYKLVKDHFQCTHRGKIDAKHKGRIDMYFVEKELKAMMTNGQ